MKQTFPEINAINSVRDCRLALRMGYNNFDSVKPEFQPELKARLEALEERMRRLKATQAFIGKLQGVR